MEGIIITAFKIIEETITNVVWNNIDDINILNNKDHNEEDGINSSVNAQLSCDKNSINVISSIAL
jgi:hypothetical protein